MVTPVISMFRGANGDTANKIGTDQMAVLAKESNIAFYIAARESTFDPSIPDGEHMPIEERTAEEVTHILGVRIAPVFTRRIRRSTIGA